MTGIKGKSPEMIRQNLIKDNNVIKGQLKQNQRICTWLRKAALALASVLLLSPSLPCSSSTLVKHFLLKNLTDSNIFAQTLDVILFPLDWGNHLGGSDPRSVKARGKGPRGHVGDGLICLSLTLKTLDILFFFFEQLFLNFFFYTAGSH